MHIVGAKHVHMVGIGGIGMSALAQLLVTRGVAVSGSDRNESLTTTLLESKGVHVLIGHGEVPSGTDLLIYSDAVPAEDVERAHASERGIPQLTYFAALGEISKDMNTVAIAGTHGKTTTTGMLAKILSDIAENPTAIVGSLVRDFPGPTGGSNFLTGREDLLVVEACEYRNHLLELSPRILVITNIELDHTDFFPSLESLIETFRTAAHRVPRDGYIVANPTGANIAQVLAGAQARIVDYTQLAIGSLLLPGEFNRENGRAALAAARALVPGMDLESGVKSLSKFQGSWRRFEYKGETKSGAQVYDDYAHHPTAVEKTILAAREKFPDKKIVVAFHPHLYSRTKSFLNEFARALALADDTLIAPIYAAREVDDGSVTSELLAAVSRDAGGSTRAFNSFDTVRRELEKYSTDTVIITMGAGDIYKVAEEITQE